MTHSKRRQNDAWEGLKSRVHSFLIWQKNTSHPKTKGKIMRFLLGSYTTFVLSPALPDKTCLVGRKWNVFVASLNHVFPWSFFSIIIWKRRQLTPFLLGEPYGSTSQNLSGGRVAWGPPSFLCGAFLKPRLLQAQFLWSTGKNKSSGHMQWPI